MSKNITLFFILIGSNSLFAQSTLNIKAFVQGYYIDIINQMKPLIDPVNQPNVFDTIRIELHESTNGNLAYSFPAIFDINGNSSISVPAIYFGNNYYIALRHRNSIETWSALPVLITNNASYDFSTGIAQAYGNNMILVDVNGASALFTGDINQDGIIDSVDMNIIEDSANVFAFGYYYSCDLNGDSAVDGLDMNFLDNNSNGHHAHSIIPHFTSITQNIDDFIFPNPATDKIIIKNLAVQEDNAQFSYSLLSSTGQEIATGKFSQEKAIDISGLAAGIYVLLVKEANGASLVVEKIVKE